MATSKEQKIKQATEYAAKVEKLKGEIKALEEKQAALEATRISKARRQADTTAKILLGAASMSAAKKGNGQEWIAYLIGFLTERDKKRLGAAFATLGIETPAPRP